MAEPTGSLLPTAYDDATSLLGELISQRSFELSAAVSASDTTLPVFGNLADIEMPIYVMFPITLEVVFCETKSGDNLSFTDCIRGARGSDAAAQASGDVFLQVLSGKHANMMRDAVIASQKYPGLVGTDAGKAGSPAQNELYFATDVDKVYAAVTAGAWQFVGPRPDHADLDDLTEGEADHTQYHNDARAVIWHDGLMGGHVTGGDTHDHGIASADGAGRVQAGLASGRSGTPTYEREIYYETDTDLLYIAKGTAGPGDWVKIVGAPIGTIVPFLEADITSLYGGACPPGWSRFTALDDRFAKGANTGEETGFSSGGATTHSHDYTDVVSHNQTVPAVGAGTNVDGDHNHTMKEGGGSGDPALDLTGGGRRGGSDTTAHGNHSHTFSLPVHNTESTVRTSDDGGGVATGTTAAVSSMPTYQEIIFCEKD